MSAGMQDEGTARIEDLFEGRRVELHPATDEWMMGDRYGVVIRVWPAIGRVSIKLDKSGRTRRFRPEYILDRNI